MICTADAPGQTSLVISLHVGEGDPAAATCLAIHDYLEETTMPFGAG